MSTRLTDLLRQEGPEVYYAPPGFLSIGDTEVDWLIAQASKLPRLRCRICLHKDPQAAVHDMLIVHHRSCYVRPHRHRSRAETLSVLRGQAVAALFNDSGDMTDSIPLGPLGSGRMAMYRMPSRLFHSLVIESDWLVFLETTSGPFDAAENEFANWSPEGSDGSAASTFVDSVRNRSKARQNTIR